MSHDHKPGNKEENARITAAGGFVEFGRVNGNLALSRAVGDFEFKQNYALDAEHQVVTVNPDILTHDWTGEEEFLVVACDGIWDCLSNQQVVDFTRRAIANGDSLTKICEDMMEKCLAPDSELGGVGCDNMTVVIVALLGNRSFDEWKAWITERVEAQVRGTRLLQWLLVSMRLTTGFSRRSATRLLSPFLTSSRRPLLSADREVASLEPPRRSQAPLPT